MDSVAILTVAFDSETGVVYQASLAGQANGAPGMFVVSGVCSGLAKDFNNVAMRMMKDVGEEDRVGGSEA